MGSLGKPPASSALLSFQEPVAARAVALALSEPQRRYTQYECGRMQPLLYIEAVINRKLEVEPKRFRQILLLNYLLALMVGFRQINNKHHIHKPNH